MFRDMNFHSKSDDSIPSSLAKIHSIDDIQDTVKSLLGWSVATQVTVIEGGITNRIYKANDPASDETVVVRVFGGDDVFTPEARRKETDIFEELGNADISPRLVGKFGNGRLEEYIHGARPIELEEMTSVSVLDGVAKEMAKLHTFTPSNAMERKSEIWTCLDTWIDDVKQMDVVVDSVQLNISSYIEAVQQAKQIVALNTDIVFAHNDLLSGNIMQRSEDASIRLIDFEYSGFNYRAYDIGNFFAETMGGTQTGLVHPELYASESKRRRFCHKYLFHLSKNEDEEPSDDEVDALLQKTDDFVLISHLYWGFWGLVQSKCSTVEFPYQKFASQRFNQFSRNCHWN